MSYFESRGFQQDAARFFRLLDRIATALEKLVEDDDEKDS